MTTPSPAISPDPESIPGSASTHDDEAEEPLLLLASASAGRRQVLTNARIAFSALAVDLDEERILADATAQQDLDPAEQVLLLAREKASAATARSDGGFVVLGADSMLEFNGEVLGKPGTADAARERWRAQRGHSAVLHSGHWLIDDRDPEDGGTGATLGATASATVHFADLSDAEIDAYVASGEPLFVAGGFTIDGIGGPFISSIEGDPHAVVGLSLPVLRDLLGAINLSVSDLWEL